jgi:hypothetical protein
LTKVRQWGIDDLDMVIIETTVFTRQVLNLLSDQAYRELQMTLAQRPDVGDLIKGGGGLRKVRCMIEGRGKRGGIRLIYLLLGRSTRTTAVAIDVCQE